ncbi:RNA polymerase II C-terminal domain phosphatase-like protein 1 [Tanacetum coccineum]
MYKSSKVVVYDGEKLVGEVEVYFNPNLGEVNVIRDKIIKGDKIRISYYTTPSERCSPLAVLHTLTSSSSSNSSGVCFKLESNNTNAHLVHLHTTCLTENKTAVASLGGEELHLVAMRSRRNGLFPCFWGFIVQPGLYESCLVMLNLRCLGIVFDLDETLIVANTLRSFEDRIEALHRKVSCELDPQRLAGMLSEIKRYQDDRNLLKQYAESDKVIDNGKLIKAQSEVVPALSDSHQSFSRPLIRLPEKNIILTRINPTIRDTSVLVRLRPNWEDLRSYLMARGRKRFEVYVCTMAERDYALEMWRLLDPDSNLISIKELLTRVVCVKSGLKKSLYNVFQDGNCHPKMALVIDDRLKVWDERDQPRVHVVPAFAPYYAPQAETTCEVPILCFARNVACNVRGGFFKDFDDSLLQRINEVAHEDDIKDILPPDVSNYLISEEDASNVNGSKELHGFDGMADAEVERRLKEAIASSTITPVMPKPEPVLQTTFQYTPAPAPVPTPAPAPMAIVAPTITGPAVQYPNRQLPPVLEPLLQVKLQETSVHSSPAREEGEVPESELDPDTRRRLLILQHGMDMREPPQIPVRPPIQVTAPRVEPNRGGWFPPMGEEMGPRQLNRAGAPKEFPLQSEPTQIEKTHPLRAPPTFVQKVEASIMPDRVLETQRLPKEVLRDDRLRLGQTQHGYPSFSGKLYENLCPPICICVLAMGMFILASLKILDPVNNNLLAIRLANAITNALESGYEFLIIEFCFEGEESFLGQSSSSNREMDIEAGGNDTYAESPAEYLHFIAFKCGTKAEFKPALVSSIELRFAFEVWFAGEKIGEGKGRTRREAQHQAAEASLMTLADKYLARPKTGDEGRFISDGNSFGHQPMLREESMAFSNASGPARPLDTKVDVSRRGPIAALNELCMMEGLHMTFQQQAPTNMSQSNELYAQVEIDGEVWGKGVGLTWDEAKMQAAEIAFLNLKQRMGQFPQKRQLDPRSFQGMPNKRFRPEYPRVMQRMPSSARYPKNASPIDHDNNESGFSVAKVWDCIRPRGTEVNWFHLVWFIHQISRHAIHLWLIIRRKLKTQDTLRQWDVWEHMRSMIGIPNMPSSLDLIVDFLIPLAKKRSARSVIAKLVFAASCYFIWQERNDRLFAKKKRSHDQVIDAIKSIIRLKLLTCKFKKTMVVQMLLQRWKLPYSLIRYS